MITEEDPLYEYAVGALGRRMRSVAEMKRLLRQRTEDSEIGHLLIDVVIARLKQRGYLNDTQYATSFSSYRRDNEKLGRRRIVSELRARGVHAEVIEKTVEETYGEVTESEQVRAYVRRKRLQKPKDQKQTARIFRTLVRAGFGPRDIFAVLKQWDVDDETLSLLESETP